MKQIWQSKIKLKTRTISFIFIFLSLAFVNFLSPSNKKNLTKNVNRYPENFSINKFRFSTTNPIDCINHANENLLTGNPSNAENDFHQTSNLLLIKPSFALSYNNSKRCPNWVSWHLSSSWKGNAKRCNCFTTDKDLPYNFHKVSSTDYSKTGFDRGHLCPSEDRDLNQELNAETFLMTNMIPQSPNLNRITWVALENYCRKIMDKGNELYIISGGYGKGGIGSKGFAEQIGSGLINVPSHCWKIIIVLPDGDNDLKRITANTRVIAVDIPNNPNVKSLPWYQYKTTIDDIEIKTGFDFLNKIPDFIERHLESTIDHQAIN